MRTTGRRARPGPFELDDDDDEGDDGAPAPFPPARRASALAAHAGVGRCSPWRRRHDRPRHALTTTRSGSRPRTRRRPWQHERDRPLRRRAAAATADAAQRAAVRDGLAPTSSPRAIPTPSSTRFVRMERRRPRSATRRRRAARRRKSRWPAAAAYARDDAPRVRRRRAASCGARCFVPAPRRPPPTRRADAAPPGTRRRARARRAASQRLKLRSSRARRGRGRAVRARGRDHLRRENDKLRGEVDDLRRAAQPGGVSCLLAAADEMDDGVSTAALTPADRVISITRPAETPSSISDCPTPTQTQSQTPGGFSGGSAPGRMERRVDGDDVTPAWRSRSGERDETQEETCSVDAVMDMPPPGYRIADTAPVAPASRKEKKHYGRRTTRAARRVRAGEAPPRMEAPEDASPAAALPGASAGLQLVDAPRGRGPAPSGRGVSAFDFS